MNDDKGIDLDLDLTSRCQKESSPVTENDGTPASKAELIDLIKERDIEMKKLLKRAEKAERLLERANSYNEDLKVKIASLSQELHEYRTSKKLGKSVLLQVSGEDIEQAYGEKPMPTWGPIATEDLSLSIAESLKAAAEEVVQEQDLTESHENPSGQPGESSTDYIYDTQTGFYYHPTTGYYWDPVSCLFYDYTSGTYYQYNDATGEYAVHSQVDITANGQFQKGWPSSPSGVDSLSSQLSVLSIGTQRYQKNALAQTSEDQCQTRCKSRKRKRKIKKPRGQKQFDTEDVIVIDESESSKKKGSKCVTENSVLQQKTLSCTEEYEAIEISDESEDGNESSGSLATGESELESSPESGEISDDSNKNNELSNQAWTAGVLKHNPQSQFTDELAEHHPPCIRLIVQESEHLMAGSLFMITCTGGTIGREPKSGHAIEIPDLNVSKFHVQVNYDYDLKGYSITDQGSQNGTFLNKKRLSQSKEKSAAHPISHDDILEVGSTCFLLHIHNDHDTCEDCEPGQVQAKLKAMNPIKNDHVVLSKNERNRQRMKELRQIKKKYGLQNSHFENKGASLSNSEYSDKAYLRRKYIGSEPAHPPTAQEEEMPASVQNPISASNKGHKLLSKMGWKEGEGLGKTNSGISTPVNVELRVNQSAGLGSSSNYSLSLDNVHKAKKAQRWSTARQMYNKLEAQETQSNKHLNFNMSASELVHASSNIPNSHLAETNVVSDSSSLQSDHLDLDHTRPQNIRSTPSTPVMPFDKPPKKYSSAPKIMWVKGATQEPSASAEDSLGSQGTKIT